MKSEQGRGELFPQVVLLHLFQASVTAQFKRIRLRGTKARLNELWNVAGRALDVGRPARRRGIAKLTNSATSKVGPSPEARNTPRKGKTPVPDREEERALLAAIDTGSLTGLRDRAFIGIMIFTFRQTACGRIRYSRH